MSLLPKFSKWQIKLILLFAGLIIVVTTILYTRELVDELILNERNKIQFYADMFKRVTDPDLKTIDEFYLVVNNIAPTISFPIIITDEKNEPIYPFEQWSRNVDVDTSKPIQEQREYMNEHISNMSESYPPIIIKDKNNNVLMKFFYTHSEMIDRLQLFPILEFIIIAILIIIGYLAFSNIRRNEESKVWVGMAKEAAHQLGTPLSSLLAWLEILKNARNDPGFVEDTVMEMENDINRLNIIATRFSKIGSMPELKSEDIASRISDIVNYFEKRLPHLGKKIKIEFNVDENAHIMISPELFAWVIENLLKNAAEAIESKDGIVVISISALHDKKVLITVKDNGKGMTAKLKRQVFHPGFTTKKRGWGLGLSLSKRIIEQYHNGKIYIKDTSPGKGTTFAIELPFGENTV
jgi:signal transduction histidine kinase